MPWDDGKILNYAGSGLLINRLLVPRSEIGPLSKTNENVVTNLQARYPMSIKDWGADEVRKHARFYFELFRDELLIDLGFESADDLNAKVQL